MWSKHNFLQNQSEVNRLGDQMKEIGSSFTTLHGGMNQEQRDKAMKKFSSGRSRILIATDVASRGIDVTDVSCVIHFDPPDDGKVYKHRSGRTARAGSTGTVVCLVLKSQIRKYRGFSMRWASNVDSSNPISIDSKVESSLKRLL